MKTGWERKARSPQGKLIQPARSEVKEQTKFVKEQPKAAKVRTIKVEETGQIPINADLPGPEQSEAP